VTSLRVLVIVLGVALGVWFPFISVILADRGFGPGEIGLITSLAAIGSTIAVPTWGHIADVRLGRSRTLRICAVGGAVSVGALLLAWPPLVVVALVIAFWVFECSWQPLADAITVNALGGRAGYARIRLLTSLGFALSTILAGLLYEQTGYVAAFVLFAAAAVIMALTTFKLPDVGRADLGAHAASAADPASSATPRTWRFGSSGVAIRLAPKLPLVLLAVAFLHVGIISGFTFLSLRLLELGAGPAEVAASSALSAGMEVPSMMVAGWVAMRIGLRGMFAGSAVLYAACLALWAVTDQPALIVGSRLLTGVAMAWVIVSVVLTIARLLPSDLQATGQALFQMTAFGAAAVVANVLGGILYATSGHEAVFGLGAVLAVVAAAVGWFAIPRRPSVASAVAR
jgi:PPP family 3-phenylpropionic acid transporter